MTDPQATEFDLGQLVARAAPVVEELERLAGAATANLRAVVTVDGRVDGARLDANQHAAHALAWLVTYVTALGQMRDWAGGLVADGKAGPIEARIFAVSFGESLHHIRGGIPMWQGEYARLSDLGVDWQPSAEAAWFLANGSTPRTREALYDGVAEAGPVSSFGATRQSEELDLIRETFRRYAEDKVAPFAHAWHLKDALIPADILSDLAGMGVFALTIPEEHGGMGMSKESMVVVSEELSRGYIGVGSLGTRAEIAAELIIGGGTEEQKAKWLPLMASGEVLPTAVFTEPDTGSDLGSLRTRAERDANGDWLVTGNKTWITHAARASLMTLLVRTDPQSRDHRGLSMLLAEKEPMRDGEDFPSPGIQGGEIPVIGYRGMKEYELSFDRFRVKGENLLGGVTGQGFKQLMQTFESARIQTAARAVGVAQAALEQGLRYSQERRQFGRPLGAFQRVSGKVAIAAAEIMLARQLTYFSARRKDSGERCDLEAGMAKLLAARVAWMTADSALQIHGGNGFAQEYVISRLLADARILNIFEGAGEIQAQVIARRLLEQPANQ